MRSSRGRQEWADHQVQGLYFRVTPRTKSWSLRYRVLDGSQRRLDLGDFPDLSLAVARARALGELAKVSEGRDPVAELRRERRDAETGRATKPRTFDDLHRLYAQFALSRNRPATVAYTRWLYAKHVAPLLGSVPLPELDRASIRFALRKIGNEAPTTANRAKALISTSLNWGVAEQFITMNPIAQMKALYPETSRDRVLTDAEIRRVWAATEMVEGVELNVSKRLVLALQLAFLTLARGNEVAGLHAAEVDVAARTWTIPPARHKSKQPHVIPLSDGAWGILLDAFGPDPQHWAGFAFPNARHADRHLDRASMTHGMRRLVVGLRLPDVSPHDFRRTAATLIASERVGAPPHIISALLGHSPNGPKVTGVYNRYHYIKEKRSALTAWESLLRDIVRRRTSAAPDRECATEPLHSSARRLSNLRDADVTSRPLSPPRK